MRQSLGWSGTAFLLGSAVLGACTETQSTNRPPVVVTADPAKDNVQNGDETGVDCGGSNTAKCAVGEGCQTGKDCASTSCVQRACRIVSASNGLKDGLETDIDCGGSTAAPKCGGDKSCALADDCISAVCRGAKCAAPAPNDDRRNGDETDIDCGGSAAPACADGKQCALPADCADVICSGAKCVLGTHSDGVRNAGESGTDCGGSASSRCGLGLACASGSDCAEHSCVALACAAPTYADGVKNGAETDTDCGGDESHACGDTKGCALARDCTSMRCTSNVCLAATHADGILNLGETDVDCGGTQRDGAGVAPRCAPTKICAAHADCGSDGCNADTLVCADAKSCAQNAGGQTCGKGETGDGAHLHESCCTSVYIPRPASSGGAYNVDKYVMTAGRMRQFIERTGGNLALYMQGRSDWSSYQSRWGAAIVSHLPTSVTEAEHLVDGTAWSSWEWKDPAWTPGDYRISGFGCFDAHSYHVAGDPYSQAFTDEKMLNCVHHFMADALCRWDGGELWDNSMATYTWNMSTTTRAYPWGSTPVPIQYPTIASSAQYREHPWTPGDVFEYAVHKWSYPYVDGEQATLPAYASGGNNYDIPPPGRRPKGYSRPVGVAYDPAHPLVGVADLAGGLFQLSREPSQNYGVAYSGSYEVHDIGANGGAGGWQVGRRYSGAGSRCAH